MLLKVTESIAIEVNSHMGTGSGADVSVARCSSVTTRVLRLRRLIVVLERGNPYA